MSQPRPGSVDTTTPPPPAVPAASAARTSTLLRVALALAVLACVLVRLYSPANFWIDEALSVHIARLPYDGLFAALRRDGSPPFYYLLLHQWMQVFGEGRFAVRSLSALFSLASLGLAFVVGRRLGGRDAGVAAVLILGASPFAVRYATEARMYSLVVLLVLLGMLALLRSAEQPTVGRLAPVSVCSGLLALTHYWSLFLLAVVGGLLAVRSLTGTHRAPARRQLLAVLAGGVLFLPWLPTFVFQIRHTGTPWAAVAAPMDFFRTLHNWAGNPTAVAELLFLLICTLMVLGVLGRRIGTSLVIERPRWNTPGPVLAIVFAATLAVGLAVSDAVSSGYASRYSAAVLAPGLLLVALGAALLPVRPRAGVLALIVVCGMTFDAVQPFSHSRTQAGQTAATLRARVQPGDLVVYCPDQLGPAVSHLLPSTIDQVAYPALTSPLLVDWADYAQRNEAASPDLISAVISERTDGAIWLVNAPGYRTFGSQCARLDADLTKLRQGSLLVQNQTRAHETQRVVYYPPLDP